MISSLTLCAEARAGGELGHIHNFDSELLPRLSVDASPHNAEGTPEKTNRKRTFTVCFVSTVFGNDGHKRKASLKLGIIKLRFENWGYACSL